MTEHTDVLDETVSLRNMIERWVVLESPSHDAAALNAMAGLIEGDARALGLRVARIALAEGAPPLLHVHNRTEGDTRPGILVLAHYDTVHPVGTLRKNPLRLEGDRLYGPGIYDMKAGICLALTGLAQARDGQGTRLPVDIVVSPDEETGSHLSRTAIEDFARRSKYVLVCEPARAGQGRCVTARKGTGFITLKTRGRPAHAGVQHQKGRNAIEDMAHHILALQAMTDYDRGITVNVGTITGGTTPNVVPEHCQIRVDFRIPDAQAGEELRRQVEALSAVVPDVQLDIVFELNRPPMPRTTGTAALLERCQGFARQAGFDLDEAPMTGGGSDANFTAALGLATLDGIGADGDGAHTLNEHILVSTLASRQQFWRQALAELD